MYWFLLVISLSVLVNGNDFFLQAENFAKYWSNHTIFHRSRASNGKAVHLSSGVLKLEFCLTRESDVYIEDILYSNDGGEDNVQILFDWNLKGTLKTTKSSRGGRSWNIFKSSGPIAEMKAVRPGHHTIIFNVSESDAYGIELDVVRLFINDEDLEDHVFKCDVFCFDSIYYDHIAGRDFIPSARIEQKSFNTTCQEKDNVVIPFYHETATEYVIKATHPRYTAYLNHKTSNFTNCAMASEQMWSFENFSFPLNKPFHHHNAFLSESRMDKKTALFFHFLLDGPRKGIMDSEIGSKISLVLEKITEPVEVGLMYYTRYNNNLSEADYKKYNLSTEILSWDIPDFTWKEGSNNILGLIFPENTKLFIRKVELKKREHDPDEPFHIFDNTDIIIEGVKIDFWWLQNHNMTVGIPESDQIYHDAKYIRFYSRVPWAVDKYSQVFVIYADGNIRLLPMTPLGLDWIPFGSSLLVGHSDPSTRRPSAPISHIEIDPNKNFLIVTYMNNEIATIQITVTFSETIVTIKHLNFKPQMAHFPFLTFRSMWVADGNADVDHVSVNGNPPRRVLSDWKELYGTSFVFYRKCLSSHNTLSPDIRVQLFKN